MAADMTVTSDLKEKTASKYTYLLLCIVLFMQILLTGLFFGWSSYFSKLEDLANNYHLYSMLNSAHIKEEIRHIISDMDKQLLIDENKEGLIAIDQVDINSSLYIAREEMVEIEKLQSVYGHKEFSNLINNTKHLLLNIPGVEGSIINVEEVTPGLEQMLVYLDQIYRLHKTALEKIKLDIASKEKLYSRNIFISLFLIGACVLLLTGRILKKIRITEIELKNHRDCLQELVEKRTAKLLESNKRLSIEILEHKITEEKLKEAKELAEVATIAKSEFLANMSHEIRTPMNVIIGMADILSETKLLDEQKKYVYSINKAGESLLHLINSVLDISKIEAGQIELESIGFHIKDLINEIKPYIDLLASEKSLNIYYHIEPDVPEVVLGDPNRLRQVLFNLTSNAIKFTAKGRIDINISNLGIHGGEAKLEFYVRDTGIGISEDKLCNIFDKFTQADSSTTRKYGGTGLGTAISKKLVELMGGNIWIESKIGHGSTFYFTVKLKVTEVTEVTEVKKKKRTFTKGALKILLAEDSEDNRMLIQLYFKDTDFTLDMVKNGREAVDKFELDSYDLVLMDMEMPIMDGYSAVKEIRQWEKDTCKKQTPILSLTAHAMNEYKQKSLDIGCNGHISKPVRKKTLMDEIEKYTEAKVH